MSDPIGPRALEPELLSEGMYVDFGCLYIPYMEGMELIPAVDRQGRIHSMSIVVASQCVELTLFAAPRSGGLWAQSFDDLRADGQRRGFDVFPLTGPWGKELLLRPTADNPDMAHRFIGIEGPGWLLRATYFGASAEDDDARAPLDAIVANILVDRGGDARVPGEIIHLTPFDALQQAMEQQQEQS